MKVLITGGGGLVGQALIGTAPQSYQLSVLHLRHYVLRSGVEQFVLDIRDRAQVAALFSQHHFDVVIHAAGIASVDYVEYNFEEGQQSNVIGTQNIVDAVRAKGLRLVHISSSEVFDGKHAPYVEEDPTSPVNKYGQIKVECEGIVRGGCPDAVIVRPIFMYGWPMSNGRPNQVAWVLARLQQGEPVYLVNDVHENPLWSYHCGEVIWRTIQLEKTGIFHLAGKDVVNRYELAILAAQAFGLDTSLIHPVDSRFFPTIAPRPHNTSLLTERMRRELGMEPLSILDGLSRMRAQKVAPTLISS